MPRRRKRSRLPLICGCTIALLVGLQVGFHGDAAPPAPPPAAPVLRPRSLAELRERRRRSSASSGLAAREAGVARQEADAAWRELRHLGAALRAAATREAAGAAAAGAAGAAGATNTTRKKARRPRPRGWAPTRRCSSSRSTAPRRCGRRSAPSCGTPLRRGPRLVISQDAGGGRAGASARRDRRRGRGARAQVPLVGTNAGRDAA